ncbi:MAG TPA: hypothetical protein VMU59_10600 [Caulobacteraceae bacterium]|nr:hypothetical protein [Caulobacteraceae bacterium]
MTARGRRRWGRALIFVGVGLWIPELYLVWALLRTLFTPLRAANGQVAQLHLQLNGSAWAAIIGWTALCWLLIGWGVRTLRKAQAP